MEPPTEQLPCRPERPWVLTLRKLQSSWLATARARSVFPVPVKDSLVTKAQHNHPSAGGPPPHRPGGPYSRQPLGGMMPTRWKSSGLVRGSSITCNARQAQVQPPPGSPFKSGTEGRRSRACTSLSSRICSDKPPISE